MKRIYFFALTNQNILLYLLMQSLLNKKTFHSFEYFSLQNNTEITEKTSITVSTDSSLRYTPHSPHLSNLFP